MASPAGIAVYAQPACTALHRDEALLIAQASPGRTGLGSLRRFRVTGGWHGEGAPRRSSRRSWGWPKIARTVGGAPNPCDTKCVPNPGRGAHVATAATTQEPSRRLPGLPGGWQSRLGRETAEARVRSGCRILDSTGRVRHLLVEPYFEQEGPCNTSRC